MTTPETHQQLRAAAQLLLDLAAETDEELRTNPYWRSDLADDPRLFALGIDNACGGPAGRLAGLLSPDTARALAATFRAWARLGDLDPDLLNRVGSKETIALASTILASQP